MADPIPLRGQLFRPASLRARELAWQGSPTLAVGLPTSFTTLVSIGLAAVLIALLIFGSYPRRVDLRGVVLPATGLMVISAPSSGLISSTSVNEGDAVEQGTPIYTIQVDTDTKHGNVERLVSQVLSGERDMLAQQIERKVQISDEARTHLEKNIENLKAQRSQLDLQLATRVSFFRTLNNEYQLFTQLFERNQISRNEFNARQQAWMRSQLEVQDVESKRLRLVGELNDAEQQLSTVAEKNSSEIDALKSKIAEIDEKLTAGEARQEIVIRAPRNGIVTSITGQSGQMVRSGAPLLTIVPRDVSMEIDLLAPSNAIGFLEKDQHVWLRYSAFPYQKYGQFAGTVTEVGRAALNPDQVQALVPGTTKDAGPFYRVVVRPQSQSVNILGKNVSLPASMQVQAYVALEKRKLYEWILHPIQAIRLAAGPT
jgi:membrane fusion protein